MKKEMGNEMTVGLWAACAAFGGVLGFLLGLFCVVGWVLLGFVGYNLKRFVDWWKPMLPLSVGVCVGNFLSIGLVGPSWAWAVILSLAPTASFLFGSVVYHIISTTRPLAGRRDL